MSLAKIISEYENGYMAGFADSIELLNFATLSEDGGGSDNDRA